MREGAWVGRAPAGSGSGRHVEEGTWCCSNDDACRSAAPPIAPLPSRRVAASRGQYRWCGGGGSLHRPAAGAAITSMRGGCRRLVWLEAYAAPPKPYCRSSAWRLGRAAVVVADGIWRRRRRLALPSGRNSDPAALAGGGAPTAARPWLRIHLTPFLLNGYPCLLCPCVVCFKFLQPKVIEGKKIDCALADPHLPGSWVARPSSSQRTWFSCDARLYEADPGVTPAQRGAHVAVRSRFRFARHASGAVGEASGGHSLVP